MPACSARTTSWVPAWFTEEVAGSFHTKAMASRRTAAAPASTKRPITSDIAANTAGLR